LPADADADVDALLIPTAVHFALDFF